MNVQEVLKYLLEAKSDAIRGGAPMDYIRGLEYSISVIRIISRREAT